MKRGTQMRRSESFAGLKRKKKLRANVCELVPNGRGLQLTVTCEGADTNPPSKQTADWLTACQNLGSACSKSGGLVFCDVISRATASVHDCAYCTTPYCSRCYFLRHRQLGFLTFSSSKEAETRTKSRLVSLQGRATPPPKCPCTQQSLTQSLINYLSSL
jgi:hypothetical protein